MTQTIEEVEKENETVNTFLNISICIKSNEDFEQLFEGLREDMKFMWGDRGLEIFNISWDRDQALAFVRKQTDGVQAKVLTEGVTCLSSDVAAVCERFNLTLPRSKKGEADWRTPMPDKQVYGRSRGLANLYGRLVLTNGIHAIIVNENTSPARWSTIMFDNFIPDDQGVMEESLPGLTRQPKKDEKMADIFGFTDFSNL